MREFAFTVAGSPRPIRLVETDADADEFAGWLGRPRRALAVDTETTGLDIFSPGFALRLVQFGDTESAYVLPADRFARQIADALLPPVPLVFHNATYDLLVLDHAGLLVDLSAVYARSWDTRILAHLLDPRALSEGGTGHGLKMLSAFHVDETIPDGDAALKYVFRENGWKHEAGWAAIPIDHPDYVTYAGVDVIATARLFEVLGPLVKSKGLARLAVFEHSLAALLARMERRGFLLDVPYTESLIARFAADRAEGLVEAAAFGVENVESTAQVAKSLMADGWEPVEFTATGKPKVDKAVLNALAEQGNPLASCVLKAKRAAKFSTAYVEAMLALRDGADRIHPKINALQARTARMSVSRPPLQQLPSGDWVIRRCLVADPGQTIVAADYAQVELRVLAALADEPRMKAAIADGVDLHDVTATALFGEGFTKAQRKLAKNVGFGRVYGGGPATLARQAGVPLAAARQASQAYDRNFPGVKRLARRLMERAEYGKREVVTPSGRRLPLDRDRLYAATNYLVQSTARDVLAQALLDLDDAGLSDHLLIPVHDEVIAQAPSADAADLARAIQETMTMDFKGVRLDAEAEVYGPSWGHGYGAPS